MRFKKSVLLAVAAACLPILAHADLTTINKSSQPSTVRITSGVLHFCSATFPGGITPPDGQPHTVPQGSIASLCKTSGSLCQADLYPSNNCGASGAQPVGHAALNLASGTVTVQNIPGSGYVFSTDPTGTVITIN